MRSEEIIEEDNIGLKITENLPAETESTRDSSKEITLSSKPNKSVLVVFRMAYGLALITWDSFFLGGIALSNGPYTGGMRQIVIWFIINFVLVQAIMATKISDVRFRKFRLALPFLCYFSYPFWWGVFRGF